jgi:hypothetical protein
MASHEDDVTALLHATLKYLQRLPVKKDPVSESKIGRAINKLTKDKGISGEVRKVALEIKESWTSQLAKEESNGTGTKPGPSAPVKENSSLSVNTTMARKRSIDEVKKESPSSSSSSTFPNKRLTPTLSKSTLPLPVATKKTTPVSLPMAPIDEGKKKATTVASFDVFKSLTAKADLPKAKKMDKTQAAAAKKDASSASKLSLSESASTTSTSPNVSTTSEEPPMFSYRHKEREAKEPASVDGGETGADEPPRKKRKTVKFRPDDSLCEIRYFSVEQEDLVRPFVVIKKRVFANFLD